MSRTNRGPLGRILGGARGPGRPDSTIATGELPALTQGQSERQTDISTYITKIGPSVVLYDGSRAWAYVTLTLETAGPVAVGIKKDILPVLSGKGGQLYTDKPKRITISKGNRLYIAATSVNRVQVVIEPVPWQEQIAGTLALIASAATAFVKRFI